MVYYFLFFSTIAVFSPYLSLFLSARGINSAEIGIVLAMIPLIGIFIQPLWGLMNDRYTIQKPILITGFAVVSTVLVLLGFTRGIVWCMLGAVVIALFQPAFTPINDSMAVQAAGIDGYGKIRLFGSLGYAVFVLPISQVIHKLGIASFPDIYIVTVLLTLPALWLLPRYRTTTARPPVQAFSGITNLLKNRTFLLLLCFTLFVMISQWMNNNLFTLYYMDLQRPLTWLGLLYGISALSEIPLFFISGRLFKRFGAARVFQFATAVYIVRWVMLALGPPNWVIVLVQIMNGMSFGLAFAAGIAIARQVSDETNHVTAQMLYSAVNTGVATIVGSVAGGYALDLLGPKGLYVLAAGVCVVGFCLMAWFLEKSKQRGVV